MSVSSAASDESFMRRALELAARGRGAVEPNPMVGCVIVKEGRVIGEGYHRRFGLPHAEAEALAACRESVGGATVYVTLEPCCHTNKKTPPCVPRLIEAGVARVVVACLDPNPEVSGKGVEQLRAAGVDVSVGVLGREAQQLNAGFFALVRERRPYVTLKWAQTADGKVAAPPGAPRMMISGVAARQVVQRLRARCDAIMVGVNTVLTDDPLLTVRGVEATRPLMRVVLDRDLRIPLSSQVVQTATQTPTVVFCGEAGGERAAELRMLGVEVVRVGVDRGALGLGEILRLLGERSCTHLLVEPGPRLARGFLESGFADRVWVFRSSHVATDPNALDAVAVEFPAVGEAEVGGDVLTEYLNPDSRVLFSKDSSPDFELAGEED